MKLKTRLMLTALAMLMALVMLMGAVGAETIFEFEADFGTGFLDVYFMGHDVTWGTIDATIGPVDDSLWVDGDFVVFHEWTTSFTIERYLFVAHGSAGFHQSLEGFGGYGASVDGGFGFFDSHRLLNYPNRPILIVAAAGAEADYYTVSVDAWNADPPILVQVTQSAEYGLGTSRTLVSWWSNSLSSDPLGWDNENWDGGSSLELTSDYEFSLDILSQWQAPGIEMDIDIIRGVEIFEYLSG